MGFSSSLMLMLIPTVDCQLLMYCPVEGHIEYVPLNGLNDCNTICIVPPKARGRRERSLNVIDDVTVRDRVAPTSPIQYWWVRVGFHQNARKNETTKEQQTMATKQVTFYNPETDIAVEITVSVEDARRAENDLQFATALMNAALKERAALTVQSQQGDADNSDSANIQSHSQSSAQQGDAVTTEDTGLYRWTTEMVLLLLDIYVEREAKFSSGKFSQKKIWEDIAGGMRTKIPLITGPQCAAKMRSLKKTYKSVKDHNNKSGNDRRTWVFYEKMDTIFASKAWASPLAVASSSGVSSQRSQESESEVSSESSSSWKPKENVASLLKKRLRQKSEEEEARAKRHKERLDMDEKVLALLSKLVDKK